MIFETFVVLKISNILSYENSIIPALKCFQSGAVQGLQEVVAAAMFGCFVQVSCRFPADFFLKCCNGTELEYIFIPGKCHQSG